MQRLLRAAAQSQITDPKIHVPFGGPAVIKAGHEQKRVETGGREECKCVSVCVTAAVVGLLLNSFGPL